MANIILNELFNPTGLAFDPSGNFYLSSLVIDNSLFLGINKSAITQIAPNGTTRQIFTNNINPSILEFSSELGSLLSLNPDGSLFVIDPNTFTVTGGLNLNGIDFDASNVYDIATGSVSNREGSIQTSFASYGDFDVRVTGNTIQLFIAGISQGATFPFVARLEFQGGSLTEAKVLLSSTADSLTTLKQTPRVARGIAVNSQGVVLTTLPVAASLSPLDVPVAFSADFDAQDGLTSAEGPRVFNIDIFSQGITTDAADNFYIATYGASGGLGVASEGALITLSSDLNRIISTEVLGIGSNIFRDVAINPANNTPFVTVSTTSLGIPRDDLLVTFPPIASTVTPASFKALSTNAENNVSQDLVLPTEDVLSQTSIELFPRMVDDYSSVQITNYLDDAASLTAPMVITNGSSSWISSNDVFASGSSLSTELYSSNHSTSILHQFSGSELYQV